MAEHGEERSDGERHSRGPDSGREPGGRPRDEVSPWEWIVAAISAVLVLGSIGFMGHEALSEPNGPPRIEILVDSVVEQPGGYLVEFRARNSGQTTAAGLVVEGELKGGSGSVEKAQVTISFVPAESHRAAGLFFTHDPREYSLEIRPKGYDRP